MVAHDFPCFLKDLNSSAACLCRRFKLRFGHADPVSPEGGPSGASTLSLGFGFGEDFRFGLEHFGLRLGGGGGGEGHGVISHAIASKTCPVPEDANELITMQMQQAL